MCIYKKEILSAIEELDGFEIIRNNDNEDNEQGGLLAKWKGLAFFISFNDKLAINIKNNSAEDDELIYRATAYDFEITFVIRADNLSDDVVPKYKIANYANMMTDLGAAFIYREDADVFEIPVRHTATLREKTNLHVGAAVIKLVLVGSIAVQELKAMITSYIDAPDVFLKNCKGVSQ